MVAVVVVEGLAIVLLGLLVVGLLRSHADILRSLHELGADAEPGRSRDEIAEPVALRPAAAGVVGTAHDVTGVLPDDSAAAIGVVGVPHDTVLAFLSTTCLTCEPFWAGLAEPIGLPESTRLVVVVQEGERPARVRKLAPPGALVVRSDGAWQDYEIPGSPHFVHVAARSGAILGEGTGESWDQVLDLLGQARDNGAATPLADHRDNAERIDHELLTAGIGPGHPSLYGSLDAPVDEASA